MQKRLNVFSLLCVYGLALSVFADSHTNGRAMSLVDESVLNRCNHIDSSWRCERTRGCRWNEYGQYCVSDYDGGGGDYRSCYEVSSPLACSNREDCYWSRSRNRCVSNNSDGGGDYDSPRVCYEVRSRHECERYRQCHWSYSFDRCVGPNDH